MVQAHCVAIGPAIAAICLTAAASAAVSTVFVGDHAALPPNASCKGLLFLFKPSGSRASPGMLMRL